MSSDYTIVRARSSSDVSAAATLFSAYVASLNIDLTYQNIVEELSSLPGKYSPPTGELFLARTTGSKQPGEPIGCVAVRSLSLADVPHCCEMKRLYVAPGGRGNGLGKALVRAALLAAKELGYENIRLDTLHTMEAARKLYAAEGFVECGQYYDTPIQGTVFMAKAF
jgi:ribosomal protein S18 acetylase RimI-like enzyme